MKPSFRSRPSGRKFGGGNFKSRDFGDRGLDKPFSFKTTCAECGETCSVPFRPNGSKPVLCGNCFKRGTRDAGSFPAKKPWGGESRGPARAPQGDAQIKEQLRVINDKLDAILKAMNGEL